MKQNRAPVLPKVWCSKKCPKIGESIYYISPSSFSTGTVYCLKIPIRLFITLLRKGLPVTNLQSSHTRIIIITNSTGTTTVYSLQTYYPVICWILIINYRYLTCTNHIAATNFQTTLPSATTFRCLPKYLRPV